jgi:hypothetical protein
MVVAAAIAIAAAACSGNTATPSAASTNTPTQPAATATPTGQGPTSAPTAQASSGLDNAAAAMGNLTSYKYTMTLAGGTFDDMYSSVGGSPAAPNTPFGVKGTVVLVPDKSADVTVGELHIIETGGSDYLDMGNTGGFTKTDVQPPGLTDQWTPASIFAAFNPTGSGYSIVGTDTKNALLCDHYQAGASALAELASVSGVDSATWTSDIWLAQNGGFPVSMAVVARASDNSIAYEILFEITKVNDPANKVNVPTNITGA